MPFLDALIIFIASAIGETFGALFGGGGIFIQPALLLVGIPPHQAVANDVAAAAFSSLFFTFFMHQQGQVNWKLAGWMMPTALGGAVLGSLALVQIPAQAVAKIVLLICALGLAYMLLRIVVKDRKTKDYPVRYFRFWQVVAAMLGLALGFYDGVSGVASGIFLIAAITLAFGGNAKAIIGTANAVSTVSLLVAGVSFLFHGLLNPLLMAVMIPANILAAYIASRIVRSISAEALRVAFVTIAGAIVTLLAVRQFMPT